MLNHPTRQVDQRKANGLHSSGTPVLSQRQSFHDGIEVKRQYHYSPPCGILPKITRGQLSPSQVFLHHSMSLFAFATSLVLPVDQFATIPIHVGNHPKNLVPLSLHLNR